MAGAQPRKQVGARSTGGTRWAAARATAIWTAFALALLFFNPGGEALWRFVNQPPFTCIRLVSHSAACEHTFDAVNAVWPWLHLYPMLAFIGIGYMAIAVIALRRRFRPRIAIATA